MPKEIGPYPTAAAVGRRGVTSVEYALIAAGVAGFIISAYTGFAQGIATLLAASFPGAS